MPRIFACLCIGNLIVLVGTGAIALLPLDATPDRHVLLAVFTLLVTCLTQVIVFTYFTVTSKMIRQATHLGGLDLEPIHCAQRFKRSVARHLAVLVGFILLVTASGADHWYSGEKVLLHFIAAGLLLLVYLFVSFRQYALVVENAALLARTLLAYRRRKNPPLPAGQPARSLAK